MFILVVVLLSTGCGGGGGGGGGAIIIPTASVGSTSVSGTTGSSSSGSSGSSAMNVGAFSIDKSIVAVTTTDTIATLIVDSNGDLKLTSTDAKYSTPVLSDGSFSFDNVTVSNTGETLAQLSVEKDGFAPVVKTLHLKKDTPISVLAEVGNIPVMRVVNKLPDASSRANTYLKFGINKTDSGLKPYSKFMSLAELKAEADAGLDLNESTLSESTIPLSAFSDDVTSVTADLQAFDSTSETDIAMFPGAFTGHGKPSVSSSATSSDTENALESAAFDMIKLTDQNGKDIVLNISSSSSKLLAQSVMTCGGMYWRRHVNSSQDAIIMAWGDEDNTTAGYQVPIWSNDNATGSWEYVGLATYDHDALTFEMCVDKKWQGYLNCDSEINVGQAPKKLCVYTADQFGEAISGFEISAKHGNSYDRGYVGSDGYVGLDLATDADSVSDVNSKWEFYYRGAISAWTNMRVSQSATESSESGCDYDLNVTITSPYTATVKVKAYSQEDNETALLNTQVKLINTSYRDSYSKTASTGSTGEAVFKVKPNVTYTARYLGGESAVRVDGTKVSPETSDNGTIASVNVQDENHAPTCSVYLSRNKVKTTSDVLAFTVMGNDSNGDNLTLSSLKLNGTVLDEMVDYTPSYKSGLSGSFYMDATLELNSATIKAITPDITKGSFTLEATLSDGKLSATSSRAFEVVENSAPEITSVYFVNVDTGGLYYQDAAIPVGEYNVYAVIHDNDGDPFIKTIKVDRTDVSGSVSLGIGNHTISVTATEDTSEALSSSRDFNIYIGNHAPVLSNVLAVPNRVDIKKHETFVIHALATDIDGDSLTLSARDENGTTYGFTKNPYNSEYISEAITINSVKKDNQFVVIANDGDKNSTEVTVSVESYASNLPPVFDKELSDRTVEVNTQQTFECNATDPEGTEVTYSWKIDDVTDSETSTVLTHTFTTTGAHYVSCTATDSDLSDPKSATSMATILVTNPAAAGTLVVHTGYEGVKVTRHDTSTFALLEEKETDSSGNATFSVTGDRTTFAVTGWSGMSLHKKMLMEIIKQEIEMDARNICTANASAASECATVDWCSMYDTDTIATWVWQLSADNDSDNNMIASSMDTNSDGVIDSSELYTALLSNVDANHDGKISFAEIDEEGVRVNVQAYVNVPVRDYYINFSASFDRHAYDTGSEYEWMCSEDTNFDANMTIHYASVDTSSKTAGASGSGYGWANGTLSPSGDLNVTLNVWQKDSDDKYSFLLREKNDGASQYNYLLVAGKTQAELEAGVTVQASDFATSDTNVSLIEVNASSFGINTMYKGVMLSASDSGLYPGRSAMFYTNPAFTYLYYGNDYSVANVNKLHYGYYGDTTLNTSYDPRDYPFLDVDISFDKTGQWSISGSDMGKLNRTSYRYENYVYDANTSTDSSINVTLNWTIAPTRMPSVNILDVMPDGIKDDVRYVLGLSNGYSESLYAEEIKGLNETQYIDLIAGSFGESLEVMNNLRNRGIRSITYARNVSSASSLSAKSINSPMFSIDYDVSKAFK
jgi:hypothetical protein